VLEVEDNLGGGTVVTITVDAPPAPEEPGQHGQPNDVQRSLLALLLRWPPPTRRPWPRARPAAGRGGRELVLLEHRGFVARFADGGACSPSAERRSWRPLLVNGASIPIIQGQDQLEAVWQQVLDRCVVR